MFINFVIWIWNNTACIAIKEVILPLLRALVGLIAGIISFFNGDSGIVRFMYTIIHYMEMMTCDFYINCNFEQTPTKNIELGALPVASRCWVDYSPEIDASDSFACTRSDTCRVSGQVRNVSMNMWRVLK